MYRWVEHTGEMELAIEAGSEAEVFEDALAALAELLGDGETGAPLRRRVAVEGDDRARLLAAWIAELAFLAETEGLVPRRLEDLRLGDGELQAMVAGHAGDPPHLVKAVTYHRLAFERGGETWHARAVLDV